MKWLDDRQDENLTGSKKSPGAIFHEQRASVASPKGEAQGCAE